jgi:hypothetical protein
MRFCEISELLPGREVHCQLRLWKLNRYSRVAYEPLTQSCELRDSLDILRRGHSNWVSLGIGSGRYSHTLAGRRANGCSKLAPGIWPGRSAGAERALADLDQAALSARYRYKVARLTPRYLAMSLMVCPSSFMRLAVAMS